jgi:hypothetical protein
MTHELLPPTIPARFMVQGTDFDLGNNLDALAKLPVEQQRQVAEFVRNKDLLSAKVAISPPVGPASDLVPKQTAALMAAWNKACPEARNRFLARIDRSAFDNTRPCHPDRPRLTSPAEADAANGDAP